MMPDQADGDRQTATQDLGEGHAATPCQQRDRPEMTTAPDRGPGPS